MTRLVPYFERPAVAAPRGRLLLVSWHFPPGQSAGALRWQKMAPYFAARGWHLDVITAAVNASASPDPRRLDELPEGTRVYITEPRDRWVMRVDRWRDRQRARRDGERRSQHTDAPMRPEVPDTRIDSVAPEDIRWSFNRTGINRAWNAYLAYSKDAAWSDAARELGQALLDSSHRAVVSCGPPHPPHIAACDLARRAGLPFIMDMRDPWAVRRRLPSATASPISFAIADRLEATSVASADLVVANTEALATAMRTRHPQARIISVMNGFDDDVVPSVAKRARFTLAYAGAVYLDRDPSPLFDALARVVRVLDLSPEDIALEFIGPSSSFGGVQIHGLAERAGIARFVTVGPRLPRAEALAFLASAHMLVSLPQDSPYAIPSKVFEYMTFPSWILALAGHDSPTAVLLADRGADVVPPNDIDAIAARIAARFTQWRAGEQPRPLSHHRDLSRETQSLRLLDAVEPMLQDGARSR